MVAAGKGAAGLRRVWPQVLRWRRGDIKGLAGFDGHFNIGGGCQLRFLRDEIGVSRTTRNTFHWYTAGLVREAPWLDPLSLSFLMLLLPSMIS